MGSRTYQPLLISFLTSQKLLENLSDLMGEWGGGRGEDLEIAELK